MAENSLISWTDHTFNPWIGCAKVSPACDGCYAEHLMQTRMGRVEFGGPGKGAGTRARTAPENWRKPIAWDKAAKAKRERGEGATFVFCASLADVFDNEVPEEWRSDLFDLIRATPNLTWLLLTKRAGMIERLWWKSSGSKGWPANAAIGSTIVTQEEANRDVPKLIAAAQGIEKLSGTKPAFLFLSMEPLLEAVDLSEWLFGRVEPCAGCPRDEDCECGWQGRHTLEGETGIGWVITGGETDQGLHKARPSHPQWFRNLRDQCAAADVPFHHKQNGEWVSVSEIPGDGAHFVFPDGATVRRIGKYRSGRTIDGVEHDARPVV